MAYSAFRSAPPFAMIQLTTARLTRRPQAGLAEPLQGCPMIAPMQARSRHLRSMQTVAAGAIQLGLLAWFICGAYAMTATGAKAAEPIKIGAVLPFSGGVELYGAQAKLGIDLAVKEINAAGGILGRPVEALYEDDKTDPVAAVEATRKLVERDGVLAVVGPITSRNLNAIAPIVEGTKTPLLYATNYEGGKCSRYVFSFSTVPNQELALLLPYMNRTFGNSYFLLGADRAWPHRMFDAAEPMIRKLGGRVVGKEFTEGKETDFGPLIARIAATKAKVLLFALKGDGLNFIPQADDRGLLKRTTIAFLGLSETDLGIFGGKGQNMFVVVPFVATSGMPAVKAFVAKVKAQASAGATVSNYVMTHYNALIATKAAIEKAGKVDKESMIDALEGLAVPSPTGPLTMGKNHHATMNLFLAKTKGGDLVTVRALGQVAPDPGCR
jgi:branched-chain amino acid transport system substrate-binding protein/urea transport system substrate-binding protein